MGTLVGHVAPGFGFLVLGLWHLFNHIKLYAVNPKSYTSLPWFPSSKIKYIELFFIMLGSSISVAMELFIGPDRHQPFDTDGTIPSNHLHNFEHSSISLTFFVYALFAILLDKTGPLPGNDNTAAHRYGLTQLLAALAFGQQLFLFHLHSADHMGIEGQYHLLLQIVIVVSLATTLIGIGFPRSFIVGFVRSASIAFQGVWFVLMGYMLWTPSLIPKGCFLHVEEGHQVVRCSGDESLHRAKSLVNIQFSWFLILMSVFVMAFYLGLETFYGGRQQQEAEYSPVVKFVLEEESDDDDDDVEAQKKVTENFGNAEQPRSFIRDMGREVTAMEIER